MLARAIKMTFWVLYDHLGKLVLVNIFCAGMILTPLGIAHALLRQGLPAGSLVTAIILCIIAFGVVLPMVYAGLVFMVKELIERHDGSIKTFFAGIIHLGPRAILLAAIYVMMFACLLSSIWFYAFRLGGIAPLLGYGLSALALWIMCFLLLTATIALPALAYKNTNPFAALKMAALLTLDNPMYTVGLLVNVLVLSGLAIMPPIFVFFSFAPIAALQASAYEILSRKYAAIKAQAEQGVAAGKTIKIDFGDDDDEYLCRGIRDILFPWKD